MDYQSYIFGVHSQNTISANSPGNSQNNQRATKPSADNVTSNNPHALMITMQHQQYYQHPHFSRQQYNQILHLLEQENGKSNNDTAIRTTDMLNCSTHSTVDDKWVVIL